MNYFFFPIRRLQAPATLLPNRLQRVKTAAIRLCYLLLVNVFYWLVLPDASAQGFQWARGMGGPNTDGANSIAVDKSGNVITVGSFTRTVDFDPGSGTANLISSSNSANAFISKLDASGNFVWARQLSSSSTGTVSGLSVAVDGSDNIYAAGSFEGTLIFNSAQESTTLAASSTTWTRSFICKVNSSGELIWGKILDGTSSNQVNAMAVDAAGNVYATGTFLGTTDFDPRNTTVPIAPTNSNGDIFVLNLDASGNFGWVKQFAGESNKRPNAIVLDAANNIYTTGQFRRTTDFDPGSGEAKLTAIGDSYDTYISKLDASGNFVWVKQFSGAGDEIGKGIAVDGSGNVYSTGYFENQVDFDPGTGTALLTATGDIDAFVSKLGPSGNLLWVRQMGGSGADSGDAIAVDGSLNVYTTGAFSGTADFNPGNGATSLVSAGPVDIFVSKHDAGGNLVWAFRQGGGNVDAGRALILDDSGNFYQAGAFRSSFADFNPGAGSSNSQACVRTVTASLSVIAPPSVSITAAPSLTLVEGNSVTLTASGASSYTWTGGSTGSSFTATPAATTVYSVTGINASGCTDIESTTVTVKSISCGSVIYVTQSGAGIQDGSSWGNALAGRQLQAAIDAAATCGGARQVWVAAGTYTPTSTTARDISFTMRNNVAIYGGFSGSETALSGRSLSANPTILSGEIGNPGLGDNSYNIIFNSNLDNTARLDGFVITGGNGTGSGFADAGGGIRNNEGSPVIANCIFRDNQAEYGGAFYSQNAGNPTLTNCVFLNNTALTGGGAISLYANSPVLTNCSFQGNSSPDGGVIHTPGGGSPELINCVLFNNGANEPFTGGTPQLSYCLLPADAGNYLSGPGNLTTNISPFVSASGVMLTICAPAINAGLTSASGLSGITTDAGGNPRVFEGRVDMGAYEYQSAALAITITASPSLTVTPGSVVTLTASGAVSYTWTGGSNSSSFTALPGTTTVYSVTGVTGSGCTVIQSTTVSINPIPCGPVIYVTESGAGTRDGSSWTNAVPGTALQYAIDAAAGCGGARQIWVARGSYTPTVTADRDISFTMRNNVALYGGFVGSETALSGRPAVNPVTGHPSNTTLSGEIGNPSVQGDNSRHIINNVAGLALNSSALLDGFVITGGSASSYGAGMTNESSSPTVQNCLFADNTGGGMYNYGSSPTLLNCMFQCNTVVVDGGGGVYNNAGSSIVLTNCRFIDNTAYPTQGPSGSGGAVLNLNSSLTMINSSLENNLSNSGGGAIAFYSYDSSPVSSTSNYVNTVRLESCTLTGNSTPGSGGVLETGGGTLIILNSHLRGNSSGFYGGGLAVDGTNATLINCSLEDNRADLGGGAIRTSHTSLEVTNSSFRGNRSPNGAAINSFASIDAAPDPTLTNCVLFDNDGANTFFNLYQGIITVNNSLFEPSAINYTGVDNLTTTVSPFASATGTKLSPCSPAINAGTNSASGLTGITTDLAGNPRRYQNGVVDMGAYEFQGKGRPASFTVLGSGTATCASSPTITLSGSETGVSYQLQRDGSNSGTAVAGTGQALLFGPQSQGGIYTVLAIRGNCTLAMAESATVISTTAVISASLVASGAISCNTPSVTLTASPSNLTYSFGSGATRIGQTNQAVVNTAGTYSVTVTDAGGCSAVAQVTVSGSTTAPTGATLTANLGGTLTCSQTTLTLTAGATGSGLSYSFSGPGIVAQNGTSATVNAAGSYLLVITGSNSCTTSATTTVYNNTVAPVASLTPSSVTLTCTSPAVTLTATAGYTNYAFTGGQSGGANTLLVTTAGTYSVVVTGANGCTALTSATVVSSTAVISASLVASGAISCNTPSVTLTASPASLSYSFGSGATRIGQTNQAVVTTAGVYSVTVSDAGGCSAVAQVTVSGSTTAPTGATLTANLGGTLTCSQTTLTLTAGATGSGLSYSFSGPGVVAQNGTSATVNKAGSYMVVITGSNSCTTSATTTIYSNTSPASLSITPSSVTLTCASPSAVLSVIGSGDVRWSTGAVSQTISVASAGTYSVTLTGGNGCTSVSSATVVSATAGPSLSVNPSSATATCANPVVSLSAVGTGNVRWSTGATGPVISVSVAGPYSVTLTDGGGCTAVAGAYVSVAQLGAVTVTSGGALGCGVLTTPVRVTASGATSYTLSGPNGYYQINTTGVFSVSAGGSYTGLAGQGACVSSGTVMVTEGGVQPTISSVQASGVLGSGSCSVSVQATGYGDRYELTGPGGYVFSVVYRTAGEHSVSFPTVVKPGTYTLTVYSGNCVVTRTVTVSGTACP